MLKLLSELAHCQKQITIGIFAAEKNSSLFGWAQLDAGTSLLVRDLTETDKKCILFFTAVTLDSNRQHLSIDDCLEYKSEHYQNCSLLCCVLQLCTGHEQFLQDNDGLFVYVLVVFRASLCSVNFRVSSIFSLVCCEFGCQYQCNWIPGDISEMRCIVCRVGP